jgi:hypothetical protein
MGVARLQGRDKGEARSSNRPGGTNDAIKANKSRRPVRAALSSRTMTP